jgi:hypothetical protein
VHARADLLAQHGQLLDRGRPPDVGRDQHRVPSLGHQQSRQLRGCRRLARALQAEHEDDARRARHVGQPTLRVAEQRQHLIAHDPHDMLGRRQAPQYFLADGLDPDALDERLDDPEVDVGFEQREANLAQRHVD